MFISECIKMDQLVIKAIPIKKTDSNTNQSLNEENKANLMLLVKVSYQ